MSNTFLASLREKRESKTSLIQSTLDRAAEEARDAMFKYIDRVGKVARRQVERREASEAAALAIL